MLGVASTYSSERNDFQVATSAYRGEQFTLLTSQPDPESHEHRSGNDVQAIMNAGQYTARAQALPITDAWYSASVHYSLD